MKDILNLIEDLIRLILHADKSLFLGIVDVPHEEDLENSG